MPKKQAAKVQCKTKASRRLDDNIESIKDRLDEVYSGLRTFHLDDDECVGELSDRLATEIEDIEAALAILEDYEIDDSIFKAA